jgi:hypothetical protein
VTATDVRRHSFVTRGRLGVDSKGAVGAGAEDNETDGRQR